jgi:deoxycytidylate deaminase
MTMTQSQKGLNKLYEERGNFILIGLTGRIGSGCSSAAKILEQAFWDIDFPLPRRDDFKDAEERKYKILYDYANLNWKKFECIKVKDIITSFIVDSEEEKFIEFLKNELLNFTEMSDGKIDDGEIRKHDFITILRNLKEIKDQIDSKDKDKSVTINQKEELFRDFYFVKIKELSSEIEKFFKSFGKTAHASIYKKMGDNIRSSGNVHSSDFDADHIFDIAQRINQIIKLLRKASKSCCESQENSDSSTSDTLFVIDSIKNSFEALFFRERYSAFYLVSTNTFDEDRKTRLRAQFNLNDEEIKILDKYEDPDKTNDYKIFISQDVKKCIEISDIHLNNPQNGMANFTSLKSQLVKYVMLMRHPGLVTPTAVERCMQIAYSAKLASGCISRQVGAIVTDKNFSIKAVGWNSTPENQVPCLLRSVEDLIRYNDERAFSEYELHHREFRTKISEIYPREQRKEREKNVSGRNISFCFKDIQNQVDDQKNQVHTRSLHAEENAFLQVTKYGGEGIKGGVLFTTASPCELCAKKAYQLGIEQIYYIDPYPGIALSHILGSGNAKPKLDLFRGAIGRAYNQLYQPTLPFKDELSMLM